MIASFSHGSSQKSGNQAVVLVNAPVPLPLVVELAGGHAQRRDEPSTAQPKPPITSSSVRDAIGTFMPSVTIICRADDKHLLCALVLDVPKKCVRRRNLGRRVVHPPPAIRTGDGTARKILSPTTVSGTKTEGASPSLTELR